MAAGDDAPDTPGTTSTPGGGVSWKRLFADSLLDKGPKGGDVFVDAQAALAGKHVGVYFSAHWCPPCRQFTPLLANLYTKLKKDGADFEIVFVSMDRSLGQFQDYFQGMPWLAVPYTDDQLRSVLSRKFNVQGIPALVMLSPDSTVLSANARSAVMRDPNGEGFPWAGAVEKQGFQIPWIMLAFLVFWLLNMYFFPPKPRT